MFTFLKSLLPSFKTHEYSMNNSNTCKWEVVSYRDFTEKPVEKIEFELNEVNPSPLNLFKIKLSTYTDFFINEIECKCFDDYESAHQYGVANYAKFYLRSK